MLTHPPAEWPRNWKVNPMDEAKRLDIPHPRAQCSGAGFLGGGTAALPAGGAVVATARATPRGSGDDAELIRLCAEFDDCERQLEAVYAVHLEDDPPGELPLIERQVELSRLIKGMRAHSAEGIFAIARSIAVCNGDGTFEFDPKGDSVPGRLMAALLRESLRLSGLPVPSVLTEKGISARKPKKPTNVVSLAEFRGPPVAKQPSELVLAVEAFLRKHRADQARASFKVIDGGAEAGGVTPHCIKTGWPRPRLVDNPEGAPAA